VRRRRRVKLLLSRPDSEQAPWLDRQIIDSARHIATHLGKSEDIVEVNIVDDDFIQKINMKYRGEDSPTDVISFSYFEEDPPCEENIAGELYVSSETVEKEAEKQAVDPKHLFLRVVLHGILHVLGFDHETEEEARRMEAEEREILTSILRREAVDALF
jgi:probable rRNA maturation factor